MVTTSVIAGIQFQAYEIAQLAFILIPTFLFAVHKLISLCLRHRLKRLKIEKGIVSVRSKNHGGAKWIRSIYTAVGLLVAAGGFAWYVIKFQGGFGDNPGPFLMFVLPPACVGIAYLIRGILKRKAHLKKLAISNGVPYEVICPPQKHWVLPIAIGIPLLIYTGVMVTICIIQEYCSDEIGMSIIIAGIIGAIFFLYGLLIGGAVSRNRRRAAHKQKKATAPKPTC